MHRLLLALSLALVVGCGDSAQLVLSPAARQELVNNFEAGLDAQQLLAEHIFALGRGDIDITDYTYVPPVGATPGSLTINDGVFPFGTGSLTMNFTAQGDGSYFDPYVVDFTTFTDVVVDADFVFNGLSNTGVPMSASGDFIADTVQNGVNAVQTTVDGTFAVSHDGYNMDFVATSLAMDFDLLAQQCTNVVGQVDGTLDIPDFFYDADFTVTGLGTQLQIGIDAVVETFDYFVALSEL